MKDLIILYLVYMVFKDKKISTISKNYAIDRHMISTDAMAPTFEAR